jgi:D-amino-acid oxidase
MSTARPDVLIIGAGVSGLTTAVCLAESGVAVRIRAERRPEHTTSAAAGAIWDPIYASHEHILRWSDRTYRVLTELAADRDCGVRMVNGVEAARSRRPAPLWARELAGFRLHGPDELPPGFLSGWRYTAPIVDMPVYLAYLERRLHAAGGRIEPGRVRSLAEVTGVAPVTVNCTGFGARALVPDPAVIPIRGQLVMVANPGIEEFFAEHTDDLQEMTYLLPQGGHLLLGGSAEQGRADTAPDDAVARGILERCVAVVPQLATAAVLGHRIGIRPHRREVRVEHERSDRGHVIHNYGHGGAGVSLSWGCAQEVSELARSLLATGTRAG